jgi:hypothetical protein
VLWKDRLRASYGIGFTKNFHGDTSPQLAPGNAASAGTLGGNPYDGLGGTTTSRSFYDEPARVGDTGVNRSYSVSNSVAGGVNFNEKWSLDLLYIAINSWGYGQPCDTTVNGLQINTCQTGSAVAATDGATLNRPGRVDTQVLWATLGYQPLDWLGLSLAYINWAPMQKPDGGYRQGIISTDYSAFTTVLLSATLSVDKLAAKALKKNKPVL